MLVMTAGLQYSLAKAGFFQGLRRQSHGLWPWAQVAEVVVEVVKADAVRPVRLREGPTVGLRVAELDAAVVVPQRAWVDLAL